MQYFNILLKNLLFLLVINAWLVNSVPLHNDAASTSTSANATSKAITTDDLTTEWAKEIIRRSKVADIHALLNTKVQPCNDFYQFACGNWHRYNPAQLLTDIMTHRFKILGKAFNRRLENLLNEPKTKSVDNLENKIKDFYQSCLRVQKDEVRYELALENVYKEYGELPIIAAENWNESEFNWWETIAKIHHKYGKQIIFALDIMGDVKNNTENRIYIGPPDYAMQGNTKILSILQEAATVKDLQKYFGIEHALAKETAKEIIKLQRALIQGGIDSRLGLSFEDILVNKNVLELQQQYNKSIDIHKYLEVVLGANNVPENIYIFDEQYFENVFKTLSEQPKRVLANFIFWQLLQEFLVDTAEEDLSKWCIDKTKKYFGKYIDHIVYLRYKNAQMENDVKQIWQEIRETFRDQLKGDKLDWISNATREYAIEKLDAMALIINSYENENFTVEYGSLNIDNRNYIKNVQELLMQQSRKNLAKLQQTVASGIEATEVLSFTPAYNILENNIKIPVALLQPRYFWDNNYPQALKYATMGYLIAHEMIHGFDDDGRNHDKHGNYNNTWWDKKSTYEFEERRKCFQAQYHNYKYGGYNLPESISQAENIADNAGIKLAYKAYMRWLNAQKVANANIEAQETLTGFAYNNRQLFFISFAQVWCDDVQTLFKSTIASGDNHAPSMYRVIGALSNFQEFSWVFNCEQDAPMDPEFKCAIY